MRSSGKKFIAFVIGSYVLGCLAWFLSPVILSFVESRKVARTGFTPRTIWKENGETSNYLIFRPHVSPPPGCNGYPVLMFLNGHGENGDDGIMQILNNFGRPVWEMREKFPFIVVAPHCSKGGTWTSNSSDSQNAIEILDRVLSEYPCDQDRVYLTGTSAGGTGAYEMASQFPDKFAAVVTVSGSVASSPTEIAQTFAKHRISIWSFFNGGDLENLVNQNHKLQQALFENGVTQRFTEYDRKGHNAWDYAYRDPKLYEWLLQQSRPMNAAIDPFTLTTMQTPASDELQRSLDKQSITSLGQAFEVEFESKFLTPLELTFSKESTSNSSTKSLASFVLCSSAHRGHGDEILARSSSIYGDLCGEASIRTGQWNNVQIVKRDRLLKVVINGWESIAYSVPIDSDGGFSLDIASKVGPDDQVGIRHVRQRSINYSEVKPESDHVTSAQIDLPKVSDDIKAGIPLEKGAILKLLRERDDAAIDMSISWEIQSTSGDLRSTAFMAAAGGPTPPVELKVAIKETGVFFHSTRQDPDPDRITIFANQTPDPRSVQFRPVLLKGRYSPFEFLAAFESGFQIPELPIRHWQVFERTIQPDAVIDRLVAITADAEKVMVRKHLLHDMASWARLTPERIPAAQIDTLNSHAALMAIGFLSKPPLSLELDRFKFIADHELIDGHDCVCMELEHEDQPGYTRRIWVAPALGGRICRYQGIVPPTDETEQFDYGNAIPFAASDVWIDFQYDSITQEPSQWSVVNGQRDQMPVTSQNLVKVLANAPSGQMSDKISYAKTWSPAANSWVIDQVKNEEFILKRDQIKRIVTESERVLRPTRKELLQNDSRVFEELPLLPAMNTVRFYVGALAGGFVVLGIILKLSRAKLSKIKG